MIKDILDDLLQDPDCVGLEVVFTREDPEQGKTRVTFEVLSQCNSSLARELAVFAQLLSRMGYELQGLGADCPPD